MKRNGIKYKSVAEMLRATLAPAEVDVILKDEEARDMWIAYDSRAQGGAGTDLCSVFDTFQNGTLLDALKDFKHLFGTNGPYAIYSYEDKKGELTDEQWEMDIG